MVTNPDHAQSLPDAALKAHANPEAAADELRQQAARCRRLAGTVGDRRTIEALTAMASEYDEEAGRFERAEYARGRKTS